MILNTAVFLSSIGLIVYISIDTFNNISFLQNQQYLNFQLLVCVIFLIDVLIDLWLAPHKWRFFRRNILILLISIPYLNIITTFNIYTPESIMYYIRFIPLLRATFAVAIVVSYTSSNRISSMFAGYISILLSLVYFASLIFFEREHLINPQVKTYGDAIWWAAMNVTTLGAPITPVTSIGRVLCVVLGACGMMMFPLFTIYVTNLVQRQNKFAKINKMTLEGINKKPASKTDITSS